MGTNKTQYYKNTQTYKPKEVSTHKQNKNKQTKKTNKKKQEPYLVGSNKNLNPWNFDAFSNLHIVEEGASTSLKGKYPFKQKWS